MPIDKPFDMHLDLPIALTSDTGEEPPAGLYPVRTGIPFPEGLVKNVGDLGLFDGQNRPVLHDLQPTARWSDGSLKWATLAFLAGPTPLGARLKDGYYRLRPAGSENGSSALSFSETADVLRANTGCATFVFSKQNPWPVRVEFDAATPDAAKTARDPSLPASPEDGLDFSDDQGHPAAFACEVFAVEHAGRHALTLTWTGTLASRNQTICNLQVTARVFAGSALIQWSFTLWNPRAAKHKGGLWDLGDPGSIYFRRFRLPLSFREKGEFFLNLNPENNELLACGQRAVLRQDSSGNSTWNHATHVDRSGKPTPVFRGYRFRSEKDQRDGSCTNPVLLHRSEGRLSAFAIERFRETFPNGLRVDGVKGFIEPFPAAAGAEFAPLQAEGGTGDFELQGGEKAGFTIWADFNADATQPNAALAAARFPVVATLPQAWHAKTGAWGPQLGLPESEHAFLAHLIAQVVEGENSFFKRRERFEEFGWRNFGEVAADHELLHFKSDRDFVSHYNNQYDLVHSLLARHAGSGDARWFALGRDLARHVIHHDLYHTRQDKPAYNGGYFWHTAHYLPAGTATHRTYSRLAFAEGEMPKNFGGGPSNEHNFSTGLLIYHRLTGDSAARDAVLQLAHWVRDMQNGNLTVFRFVSRNPTGLATCSRDPAYQGPGRGAAFSINTCLDAFDLSGDSAWLSLAESFIAACIHPDDDPVALDLLNREERWSYVIFLQALGKYLELKKDRNLMDKPFEYARACLLSYADWMAECEYPYLDKPDQLEFPTSTWAAQELRKVSVFLLAARWTSPDKANRFINKADYFFEKATGYLQAAPDPSTVRNLALILSQIPLHRHVKSLGDAWLLRLAAPAGPYAPKQGIIPQKVQVKRNVKIGAATLGLSLAARFALWMIQCARGRARV